MEGSNRNHSECLDELVAHIERIGENRRHIQWIIKDGIWKSSNGLEQYKMPDVIAVYGTYAIPIELKSHYGRFNQAMVQLQSGYEFITCMLRKDCPYGVFVWYEDMPRDFRHERVPYGEFKRIR
jgi:hypothetical protein